MTDFPQIFKMAPCNPVHKEKLPCIFLGTECKDARTPHTEENINTSKWKDNIREQHPVNITFKG